MGRVKILLAGASARAGRDAPFYRNGMKSIATMKR